ncbi:hypothetical protein ACVIW2_000431 [Bradyrhizobium huanghuaihaiense]|uniref:DUF6894 domain-containing protein n=1 Tax=Bradyrhizobium daqingense TaxID=993502 RepID=A0A562LLC9_9BRAD|nr:hypothetical protein [Bradyrhizobium daqingense]TWI08396.1 hypothetical protein IQ17_01210 [Bradyrhizobium daqingense]UFS87668.1 hypothetical protein LPJ38_29130 [Bradyrhizobium daqingense]
MRTYYFDMKDGVPVRDKSGLEFVSDGAAIAHSKRLADKVRRENPKGHAELRIVVLDESGREVHREQRSMINVVLTPVLSARLPFSDAAAVNNI